MSDPIIKVDGLAKRYLVGHQSEREQYQSLRDTIVRSGKNFVRKAVDMAKGRQILMGDEVEEFWALKDISFDVSEGEVLGIIGHNGAGKSTLLKVLSRITEPTEGRITLNGRVASLLEVGTGFHPELTGRENIFLNGAILGMTKKEIRQKFDEIVDFAGVEKFLDTPVKRYSSGMYVRLAFAVAAHLEPEILIVDEVLAVGDASFQKKCLGKMKSISKEGGRTVLFVSHNLSVIQTICQRCIVLKGGQIDTMGPSAESVTKYLEAPSDTFWKREASPKTDCYFEEARISVEGEESQNPIVEIRTKITNEKAKNLAFEVHLFNAAGEGIALGLLGSVDPINLPAGTDEHIWRFPAHNLATGSYTAALRLNVPGVEVFDEIWQKISFDFQAPPQAIHSYRIAQSWGHGAFTLDLEKV